MLTPSASPFTMPENALTLPAAEDHTGAVTMASGMASVKLDHPGTNTALLLELKDGQTGIIGAPPPTVRSMPNEDHVAAPGTARVGALKNGDQELVPSKAMFVKGPDGAGGNPNCIHASGLSNSMATTVSDDVA